MENTAYENAKQTISTMYLFIIGLMVIVLLIVVILFIRNKKEKDNEIKQIQVDNEKK
jgi:heme/copper-type cytochrome/quinol oxidase subunit 2